MIIYYAGGGVGRPYNLLREQDIKNYLVSFAEARVEPKIEKIKRNGGNVFLDSGGFTIFTKGLDLSVIDYAVFLKKNKEKVTVYANLDDPQKPEWTLKNQEFLESKGLKPLPVYHPSEFSNIKYRKLIKDYCKKYDYICVGGVANARLTKEQTKMYLDYVFSFAGTKIKVHGFGITNAKLLKRYPFYSVDSTSWLAGARFGELGKWEDFEYKTQHFKRTKEVDAPFLHYVGRIRSAIAEYKKLERDITKLWQSRGINWQ